MIVGTIVDVLDENRVSSKAAQAPGRGKSFPVH